MPKELEWRRGRERMLNAESRGWFWYDDDLGWSDDEGGGRRKEF